MSNVSVYRLNTPVTTQVCHVDGLQEPKLCHQRLSVFVAMSFCLDGCLSKNVSALLRNS